MNFISDKFKNLIEYKSGYTWSKEQENSKFVDGSVRVLTVTNIQEKLDLGSELYLTQVTKNDRERKAASKGWSIAVSSNGNRKRIGNAVFINDDTDYLFASFLTGFIPKDPDTVLPKYFFYWLSSHPIQERITSVSEGTTGLGNLDIRFLRNMDFEYPKNTSEQKAIAGILSKVDAVIEAVENSIKAAERLKKSLMQNLLTGKLKPDGTWRSEDDFYMDEKFGKVPKGWEVKPVGGKSLCNINPNYNFTKGEQYDFIPMDAINDDFRGLGYLVTKKVDGGGYTRFRIGDILFAKITPCTENGKVALIEKMNTTVGFASTEFIIFQPKETIDNQFYFYLLSSDRVHNLSVSLMEGTTGRQRVPWKIFKNRILAPIPIDLDEQRNIAKRLKVIEKLNVCKYSKIQSLKNLKKSLMQNLLTGKVRVDVAKINKLLEEM
ncbi:restriction endonuclease subunit S [Desulfosudis oleivorans]|uniref:Restriction modification system DNA specificity domain n=1 Tax=Desulfosudis oleivorans (strain DSM 6200 / JCM 39069 / Hxd3) TaxID=96561 RepID=A8ZYK4_DESOH|nr:restriction endonuclease subunit S [Desulfosudis oleivorans]ABW68729.1 restriction modification system DNA specificity domain [Desulfosudis oleivorans Hxd3]